MTELDMIGEDLPPKEDMVTSIAKTLNLEYIISPNWIEWHKPNGEVIRKVFKDEEALNNYLNGVLLALDLNS